jgi:hypothetical protein
MMYPVHPIRTAREVQAFLFQAIACDALGNAGAARRALERALDRAEPERLARPEGLLLLALCKWERPEAGDATCAGGARATGRSSEQDPLTD